MEKEGLEITELRLGLPGDDRHTATIKKRAFSEIALKDGEYGESESGNYDSKVDESVGKIQVVGWPPVCSYRKKNGYKDVVAKKYVKVSMDGVPLLRKVDLGLYNGYEDLSVAFEKLFGCFGIVWMLKDFQSFEYVPIYEDKDGDWMLAGDVPWQMFIESCKRLRLMKRSDAIGFGLKQADQRLHQNLYSDMWDRIL